MRSRIRSDKPNLKEDTLTVLVRVAANGASRVRFRQRLTAGNDGPRGPVAERARTYGGSLEIAATRSREDSIVKVANALCSGKHLARVHEPRAQGT